MINKNELEKSIDKVISLNYKKHFEQFDMPILPGFKIIPNDVEKCVLFAASKRFVLEIISDGFVMKNDVDNRINLQIRDTEKFLKINKLIDNNASFIYYNNFNNGIFNFKLYFNEFFILVGNKKKKINQIVAFFVENRMNDLYQISLSMNGNYDNDNNDEIIKSELYNNMILLLKNLKYNEK